MMRWQHQIVTVNVAKADELEEKCAATLDTYGDDGWEIVQLVTYHLHAATFLFKRPRDS